MKYTLSEQFHIWLDGYSFYMKRYPKAGKKKRIQNKWRNRFGSPLPGICKGIYLLSESSDFIKHGLPLPEPKND